MSAFGGKLDMPFCTALCPLLTQSGHQAGVKTCAAAATKNYQCKLSFVAFSPQPNYDVNAHYLKAFRRRWSSIDRHLDIRDVEQVTIAFDEKMMMWPNVGVEVGRVAFDG